MQAAKNWPKDLSHSEMETYFRWLLIQSPRNGQCWLLLKIQVKFIDPILFLISALVTFFIEDEKTIHYF